MKREIQIIIPMSGIGKRFIDAGYVEPKPLIEVDGEPIIKHVVDMFPNEDNIIFICNENHLKYTDMLNVLKKIKPTSRVFQVPNEGREGPVEAVSRIFDQIDDDKEVIVSYCDYGTYWDYGRFLEETFEQKPDGVIVSYKGFHPHMLGNDNYAFLKEENGKVIQIQEKKPFTNNKMEEYASNGCYYFKNGGIMKKYFQRLLDSKIKVNNEYYVSMVYNHMIEDLLNVRVFEIENMLQWGTPYDLEIYKKWSDYFKKITTPKKEIKNNIETTLILPMAGKGSRFKEKGYDLPKPLLPINNAPMVVQAVDCLPRTEKKIFVTLDGDLNLKFYYGDNIEVIKINETTEGQACTCKVAIEETKLNLETPILISACDNGVLYDEIKYNELLNDDTIDIIVWSFRNNQTAKVNPNMYAWLKVDDDNFIEHVSTKKFIYDDPLKTHAIIGTMFFRKAKYFMDGLNKNLSENIRTNNEFYVDDVLNQNIKEGLKVKVFEVDHYICWGTPNDYKTYLYWQEYFDKTTTHPYKIKNDITLKII